MKTPPTPGSKAVEELKEKLAAIEHERWADWQAWCHKILRELAPSPELEKVLERWDKQIATEYYDLNDREKDADMEQVDRYWPLIQDFLDLYATRKVVEAKAKLAKSVLLGGGELPAHTREYLQSIVNERIAQLQAQREGE